MTACPAHEELVELVDGELTENRASRVRVHVDGCDRCRREVAAYHQLVSDLSAPVAARAGAEGRLLARLEVGTRAPAAPRVRWPALAGILGALALAGSLVVVLRPGGDADQELTARGGASVHSLARDVDVSLYASRAGLQPLRDGAAVSPTTPYAVSYRNLGEPAFALVFAVDAAGEIHWISPAYLAADSDPASLPLGRTAHDVVLPKATVFDTPAAGSLRVFVVITRHPLRVSDVEHLGAVDRAALTRRWPEADVRTLTLDLGRSP